MTSSVNKTTQLAADQKLISGIQAHLQSVPSIQIDGTTYTIPQIVTELQGRVTAFQATTTTKAGWQSAVKAESVLIAETKPFVTALRQVLLLMFASSVSTLADLGLSPRKPRKTAPLTKVVAAARLRATRKARGTTSKKQKAEIKGTVPSTLAIDVPATPGNHASVSPMVAPVASDGPVAPQPSPSPAPGGALTPHAASTPRAG